MKEVKGIVPIIATPFTEKGEVDYDSFRNLVDVLIKGGCPAVTLFGIAGEYYKISEEESNALLKITVEECKKLGGVSIVSVTQHATEVAVKQAKFYEDSGADMLMLLPPFFLKPGAEALYRHMKAVGQAVKIPIMAQYAPEQTGVAIKPQIFTDLFKEVPNINYYKIECRPAGDYISALLKETENRIRVFIGNAGYQFIEGFDRGATGVMPGASMFDLYLKVFEEYTLGHRTEAQETHNKLILPMLNHIRQDVEMIIAYEKRILKKRGIIAGDYCRAPSFKPDSFYDRLFEENYDRIVPYFQKI
jgi:4-hydroxy-tetrahydrodipicolinate synthase